MNEDLFHRRHGRPRRVHAAVLAGAAAAVALGAASCTVAEKTPFIIGNDLPDGSSPGLVTTPAADTSNDGRAPLVEYCPSDRCPDGYTTCPSSLFRCDVNLQSDRNNCGACGSVCPSSAGGGGRFECVEGRCELTCPPDGNSDCDGVADNGCETPASDPKNCGGCGIECTDPAKPCTAWNLRFSCGCPSGYTACQQGGLFATCYETRSNDNSCGDCTTRCDPAGDGGTPPDNMYYGCVNGECGHLKCRPSYGNCDEDEGTGCETLLTTNENCGFCGNSCPAGESCQRDADGNYACMCPPGLTACKGRCVDLGTDLYNCGTCGALCVDLDGLDGWTSVGTCVHGTCVRMCAAGRADCNGNLDDDCEVNTNSDPKNCGGCGIVCDAVAGQACVGGRCVVEPCDQIDAGPVAK